MPKESNDRDTLWESLFAKTQLSTCFSNDENERVILKSTSASVSSLNQVYDKFWIAAGDAAVSMDPLSGYGIEMSMRSGVKAAQSVVNLLNGSSKEVEKYSSAQSLNFKQHVNIRREFYRLETRWQNSLFWDRRRNLD